MRKTPIIFGWLLFFCLTSITFAQESRSLQLLTPEIGWVISGGHLFWTTDDGLTWRDITPDTASREGIASVFFLDDSTGWALLGGADESAAAGARFDLAKTTDAGASWRVWPISLPDLDPRSPRYAGDARIDFVNSEDGWMNLGMEGNTNFDPGDLLATEDGGETWKEAPDSPGYRASVRFVTPKDGWLAGGPGDEHLYATHDGARSWQEPTLKAPPEVGAKAYPTFHLPVFEDTQHGFIPVAYTDPEGSGVALVLFATEDGGRSWKPATMLAHLPDTPTTHFTVAGSSLINVSASEHTIALTAATRGGKISRSSRVSWRGFASDLSFTDKSHGWMWWTGSILAKSPRLLSTSDGGATWTDITPHQTMATPATQ